MLPGEVPPVLPYFAGFTVAGDLEQARAYLRQHDIPSINHGRRILVGAREAGGSAVIFETSGVGR